MADIKWSTNAKGFVNFSNRDWKWRGDKNTWVRVQGDRFTLNYGSGGLLSEGYSRELRQFCEDHGIDYDSIRPGDRVTGEF